MTMRRTVFNRFPVILGALSVGAAPYLSAQGMLEEVVVTAQKREQSLQEVPAALEAFSGEFIDDAGWRDIGRLQQAVPALEIGGESKVRPFVSIRGIGTRKFDVGTDGSVGLFVDEVYNARFNSILNGIMDLERIEVLKGPQGTLYGRNTIGGAINVITRKPADEFEAKIKAAVGNEGYYQVGGNISGPLVGDKLLGRLTFSKSDVDGVQRNTVTDDTNNNELTSARGTLLYLPNQDWELTFVTDWSKNESDASLTDIQPGPVFQVLLVSPADPRVPGVVAEDAKDRYSNAYSTNGDVDQEMTQLSLTAKRTGELFDFLSITSYTDEDYSETRDFDGTILASWDLGTDDQHSTQYSQEFRLSSVSGGFGTFDDRVNWVFGLFYFHDDAERPDFIVATPDNILYFPPLGGADDVSTFEQELQTDSYAVYGQATYALTEKLNLTLGLRYTEDHKDFDYIATTDSPLPPISSTFRVSDNLEWDSTDPKVTLDYHITDEIMVYATYSEGFKSGGVQYAVGTPAAALDSFDPEELTNIEAGFKSRLWDQRLQLNLSAFNYDYKDQQVQSIIQLDGAPTALTQNAAKSDMNGAELELLALLTDSLTLDFKYAWLDAEFDEFESIGEDFSGNKMPGSPENSLSASLTHVTEFDKWGTLTLNALYAWKDDQYFNFANRGEAFQEDYGVINLAAWWDLPDGKTRLRVYCDNCDDEEYLLNFTSFPPEFGGGRRTWDYRRRYGIEVTYNF